MRKIISTINTIYPMKSFAIVFLRFRTFAKKLRLTVSHPSNQTISVCRINEGTAEAHMVRASIMLKLLPDTRCQIHIHACSLLSFRSAKRTLVFLCFSYSRGISVGMKKGIIEVADGVIINKADGDLLPAARRAASDYTSALKLMRKKSPLWTPKVYHLTSPRIVSDRPYILSLVLGSLLSSVW